MSIKITTKKEVNSKGELGYRVLEIQAEDPPEMFFEKKPFFVGDYDDEEGVIFLRIEMEDKTLYLEEKGFYKKDEFRARLDALRKCVVHLEEVLYRLDSLRSLWSGEEVFEI